MPGAEGRGTIVAGALEGSAVDLAEEMVDLVLAERAYSLSVRLAQTADEMQSLANQLVSR
jgi:flagellar basal body rod protein FlgG